MKRKLKILRLMTSLNPKFGGPNITVISSSLVLSKQGFKVDILTCDPKNSNFFIASLHQSLFETFYLQAVFNYPIFILKKELLKIPIFGWHLKKIGSISIDRDKVSKENLGFYDKIISITNITKRPVIIFPQATRTQIDDKQPFKKGVSKIYEKLNFICVPVALNSGIVWPKSGKLNSNKTITISILEHIPIGLDPDVFLQKLETELYNELDKIR